MADVVYFGENTAQNGTPPISGDPVTQRGAFIADATLRHSAPVNYDFEGSPDGDIVAPLVVAGPPDITITDLTAEQDVAFIRDIDGNGRFNTTSGGQKYLEVTMIEKIGAADRQLLRLTFSEPCYAFGFYGTDFQDFEGIVAIDVAFSDATTERFIPLEGAPPPNGSSVFWGISLDAGHARSIASITFVDASDGFALTEVFGIDDMLVSTYSESAPLQLRVTRGWGSNRHILTVRIE